METLLAGRKTPPIPLGYAPDLTAADRRPIPNLVIEARRFSGLAIDTLVELTKTKYPSSTRYTAATALLDRGYGRPAQSLDLHLSADAITKRLSDMTDAELVALEARMITLPATVALEHGMSRKRAATLAPSRMVTVVWMMKQPTCKASAFLMPQNKLT